MSVFAKIMVVVNLILAALFLAAAGTLHGATEDYKAQLAKEKEGRAGDNSKSAALLQERDASLTTVRGQLGVASSRADVAEVKAKTAEESAAAVNAENAKLKANDEQIRAANAELTKTTGDLTKRNETLSNELATAQAEKKQALEKASTLEENLERERARGDNAEKSLAAAEATNKQLTEQLDKTTVELQAYKKTYPSLGTTAMTKAVNGVISAGDAKADVWVLSVGSKDGVEVGYEFTVSRGSSYVSVLVVDAVYPNYSSARTKSGTKKADAQPGDSVSTRL